MPPDAPKDFLRAWSVHVSEEASVPPWRFFFKLFSALRQPSKLTTARKDLLLSWFRAAADGLAAEVDSSHSDAIWTETSLVEKPLLRKAGSMRSRRVGPAYKQAILEAEGVA